MKKAYILHHLGIGDHILCNSIYRHYAKQYEVCILPVKQKNKESISDMLSDLKNIYIFPLENEFSDALMVGSAYHYQTLGFDIIKLGFHGENFFCDRSLRFDANFYLQAGLDFEKRWSDFFYPRNMDEEYKLFKQICGEEVKEGEYIFLHEDQSRGFTIDRSLIQEKYKIITPGINKQHTLESKDNGRFFNYGYILENAASIHCIESSFAALIDSLDLSKSINKYAHRYARPEASNDVRHEYSYKSNWIVLTK